MTIYGKSSLLYAMRYCNKKKKRTFILIHYFLVIMYTLL